MTDEADERDGLGGLCAVAAVTAIAVGLVGGSFRWLLEQAIGWRADLVDWTKSTSGAAWLVPIAVTAAGAGIARWLVRFSPDAAGSGVQQIEGIWAQQLPEPRLRVLPIKFVGGVLAIGTGLVLGREGPTVHMGSVLGAAAARRFRMRALDSRILQAALGGAGLGVAFNAPIGGALFVFEEVTHSFKARLVMATLIGSSVAVAFSRLIVGDHLDFTVPVPDVPPGSQLPAFIVFGAVIGLLGAAYNVLVVSSLGISDSMRRIDPVLRAMVIGGLVGALLIIDPLAVGGGDTLSQELLVDEHRVVLVLLGFLAVRFLAGPLSYAAGTPGGLFAPLLAVGALCGALADSAFAPLIASFDGQRAPLVIAGMAAFFAAVVRAPFTGIVLILEMTGAWSVTVPVVAATFAAMLAATLVRSTPIYDTLRERSIRAQGGVDRIQR